ncbi:unnamed protein product, partial [Amoebophrya sp. A25]
SLSKERSEPTDLARSASSETRRPYAFDFRQAARLRSTSPALKTDLMATGIQAPSLAPPPFMSAVLSPPKLNIPANDQLFLRANPMNFFLKEQ